MQEIDIERSIKAAEELSRRSHRPFDPDFWIGYKNGLLRYRDKDMYVSQIEHMRRSSEAMSNDKAVAARGKGYRCGCMGMHILEALKHRAANNSLPTSVKVSSPKEQEKKKAARMIKRKKQIAKVKSLRAK